VESADSSETAVEIQIDDPPIAFQPGMPARAVVELPAGEAALLIPRAAVVGTGAETYVYKISGAATVRQPVTLGSEWQNDVIVLDGLVEGERVALDSSQISEGSRERQ
jgi:hypothetical protein